MKKIIGLLALIIVIISMYQYGFMRISFNDHDYSFPRPLLELGVRLNNYEYIDEVTPNVNELVSIIESSKLISHKNVPIENVYSSREFIVLIEFGKTMKLYDGDNDVTLKHGFTIINENTIALYEYKEIESGKYDCIEYLMSVDSEFVKELANTYGDL